MSKTRQCCSSGAWSWTSGAHMLFINANPGAGMIRAEPPRGLSTQIPLTELQCRAGSNLNVLQNALRAGCSGLASTPAGWKELREMVREGRRKKGKQTAPCVPQKAAFYCWSSQCAQQTCLPSLAPTYIVHFPANCFHILYK